MPGPIAGAQLSVGRQMEASPQQSELVKRVKGLDEDRILAGN